ncbi:TonB-dependent receptor domain-containing protein [Vibrio sinaloensis]|uniref:TonB-dependent receptor domain-containing protein n=1 Tax=Photobacterium sp. (strain ATCC 43367) TaxID=379097 RepID=UPI0035ECDCBF
MKHNHRRQWLTLLIKANLGISAALLPYSTYAEVSQEYSIPAGTLDSVLNQFALQSGVEFYLNSALSSDLYSQGLQGQYDQSQALNHLLSNTGLIAEKQQDGVYYLSSIGEGMTLDAIQVTTSFENAYQRDIAGSDDVYDYDASTAYIGKQDIERFKGTNAADLFTGVTNVHSGESRNGGGSIDPNIRGVQGFGRVPVVIDGTEQAITVYNGYRGASNRNYIDPNLIGSMKVYKGAQLSSDINTSTGGAVQVTTLQPQDIVEEGETFGIELVAESSSNAIEPNKARMHTGKRWQDVPVYSALGGVPLYDDPEVRFQTRDNKSDNPFDGEDTAYRLALAGIKPKFEWVAAYAYRNRGNYYSGTRKSDFYDQPYENGNGDLVAGRNPLLEPEHLARVHYPGHEVPNTSSEMESILFKSTFNIDDFNKLQFSARYTNSIHGEILASRSDYRNADGLAQWPLGNAKIQAYSLKFRTNPKSPYLDLSTNLWLSKSEGESNTGYGFPNFTWADSDTPDVIINTATIEREEQRYGFDFRNKMLLSSSVDVSFSGSYQRHELMPKQGLDYMIDYYDGPVRAGQRDEYNGSAKLEWRATDSIIFDAGVRFISYTAEDYYIENRLNAGELNTLKELRVQGYDVTYQTREEFAPEEITQNIANAEHEVRVSFTKSNLNKEILRLQNLIAQFPGQADQHNARLAERQNELANFDNVLASKVSQATSEAASNTSFVLEHQSKWLVNDDNELSVAENACYAAMQQANYVEGSCKASSFLDDNAYNTDYKTSGHGWMPSATATWLIDDDSRMYVRYAETLRFPSLFESTSGFSGVTSGSAPLEAERAKLFETAYVHYFENATGKITYFDQTIDNVMDRERDGYKFSNLDSQRTSGIELNGRFDNSDYFADGSFAYNFRNEVCDSHSAAVGFVQDVRAGNSPHYERCSRGGFSEDSYLAAHAAPEYSASVLLGARFFDQDLETGIRTNYVSGSHKDEVIKRTDVTTYDAYIKYDFTRSITGELIGRNLSDVYYLEAGSVSGMPAPGRTITVKLSGRF